MQRNGKLLELVNLGEQRGLEIHPLDRPVLSRQQARIGYADRGTTAELRARYAADLRVDPQSLVDIDYVFGQLPLSEAVGAKGKFDFVIASHFLQHVPDVISLLQDVTRVLRPLGLVCLALPDQRYTCDYFRRTTGLADLVDAYLRRLHRPSIAQAFDHFANDFAIPVQSAWNGTLHLQDLRRRHSPAEALRLARLAANSEQHFDCRCHVFTPSSFCELLRGCRELDLLNLEMLKLWPASHGEDEFVVILRSIGPPPNRVPGSRAEAAGIPPPPFAVQPRPAAGENEPEFLAASSTGGFERRVFLIRGRLRYWVTTSEWAVNAGFSWPQDVRWLADEELAIYPFVPGPLPPPQAAGTTRGSRAL